MNSYLFEEVNFYKSVRIRDNRCFRHSKVFSEDGIGLGVRVCFY